jgi:hypothetical protein
LPWAFVTRFAVSSTATVPAAGFAGLVVAANAGRDEIPGAAAIAIASMRRTKRCIA